MGERRRVRGTGSSEDMARVAEITARADTGHSSSTGSLRHGVIIASYPDTNLYFLVAMTIVARTADVTLRAGLEALKNPLSKEKNEK